jgi:hypothetical protein
MDVLEKAAVAQENLNRFGNWLRSQLDQLLK